MPEVTTHAMLCRQEAARGRWVLLIDDGSMPIFGRAFADDEGDDSGTFVEDQLRKWWDRDDAGSTEIGGIR